MMLALLLACPLCAQRPQANGTSLLILALLAAPFVIGAIVFHAVRNVDS